LVGLVIQVDAKPGGSLTDLLPYRRCMLADAAGEHQRIQTAQRRG
jgi:hypothetical protein